MSDDYDREAMRRSLHFSLTLPKEAHNKIERIIQEEIDAFAATPEFETLVREALRKRVREHLDDMFRAYSLHRNEDNGLTKLITARVEEAVMKITKNESQR